MPAKQRYYITIPEQTYEIDETELEAMAENDELSTEAMDGNFEFKCIDPKNVVRKLMEKDAWTLTNLIENGILTETKEKR